MVASAMSSGMASQKRKTTKSHLKQTESSNSKLAVAQKKERPKSSLIKTKNSKPLTPKKSLKKTK